MCYFLFFCNKTLNINIFSFNDSDALFKVIRKVKTKSVFTSINYYKLMF